MNGMLDEIRIYDRALSATEIATLYRQNETKINTSQNNKLTNGLVGLWSFDGADYNSASTTAEVLDRSGQGNNGDAVNGPVPTVGKVGQGLMFDGVDDYVVMNGLMNQPSEITLCGWVNLISASSNTEMISLGDYVAIRVFSNGSFYGYYYTGSTWINLDASTDLRGRGWTHLCYSAMPSSQLLYMNGVNIASANNAAAISYSGLGSNTFLGRHGQNPGNFLNGSLDEVRVYNRALTTAEVKQLYDMGK